MKEVNLYYKGYSDSNNRIDYLKYGLLNEFGYNMGLKPKEYYDENKIIKKVCNHKKASS